MSLKLNTWSDSNKRQHKRNRSTPANVQGVACSERIAMLREMFSKMPWIEVYDDRPVSLYKQFWLDHDPVCSDRYGGITDEIIAEKRLYPGGEYDAMVLELKREFCLVRWRVWLDEKSGDVRRYVVQPNEVAKRKVAREVKAAAREAKALSDSAGVAEREERRQAVVSRRLAVLKARKAGDPDYGVPTRGKAGVEKRERRRSRLEARRRRLQIEAVFG